MSEVVKKINDSLFTIKENDLSGLAREFVEENERLIRKYSFTVYGNQADNIITKRAFEEQARQTIERSLYLYIFKFQHWKNKRKKLHPYLNKSIKFFVKDLWFKERMLKVRDEVPKCPGCDYLINNTYLGNSDFVDNANKVIETSSNKLSCIFCWDQYEDISEDINNTKYIELKDRLHIHSIFKEYSKYGYRCLGCSRFIPKSYISSDYVYCPFNCSWHGNLNKLPKKHHPSYYSYKQNKKYSYDDSHSTGSYYPNSIEVLDFLELKEKCSNDFNVLKDVIAGQKQMVLSSESMDKHYLKYLVYQAYENMLNNYTEDMMSHLISLTRVSGHPIQSRIFQEYTRLIENSLPFVLIKNGKKCNITSLLDKNLNIFSGLSEFHASVGDNFIPNKTKEVYIGGRKNTEYGPYFLGFLIDVVNLDSKESIMDNVNNYTFSGIQLDNSIKPGTKVLVRHFRIPPHYEMGGMVLIQRVRKKIVDKVYLRLHGTKRKSKKMRIK